ncbi:MAG: inositol monophosphatase [bacterium]|nr:inositol monophosphatase [bacterium]
MAGAGDRLETAREAARTGGRILRETFRQGNLEIERKAAHDFVTSADRASEEAILDLLKREYPGDQVLSEEEGLVGAPSDYQWIIDPLDGTTNFLRGLAAYGVSVACRRAGEVVLGVVFDPVNDRLYCAERGAGAECNGRRIEVSRREGLDGAFLATGFPFKAREGLDLYLEIFRRVFLDASAIRRCGAAVLDLAHTAAGVYDGFFEFRLSAWDLAAGALLIEEAGGRVSDLDGGGRYLETGNLIAGSAGVHAELFKRIAALASEAELDSLVPHSTPADGGAC